MDTVGRKLGLGEAQVSFETRSPSSKAAGIRSPTFRIQQCSFASSETGENFAQVKKGAILKCLGHLFVAKNDFSARK